MRKDLSLPILATFQSWIDKEYPEVLPKSPMAEAAGVRARNNWMALVRYTEAGFLDIDNNVAEREMKRIAIGRKNWLFIRLAARRRDGGGDDELHLDVQSRLDVEPWAYLHDVLTRLPTTASGGLDALLPDRWKAEQRAKPAPSPTPPEKSNAGKASPT